MDFKEKLNSAKEKINPENGEKLVKKITAAADVVVKKVIELIGTKKPCDKSKKCCSEKKPAKPTSESKEPEADKKVAKKQDKKKNSVE